ncbi:MAG: hypothetical protein HUJ25_05070 [Crocinitomicaceae bacterium]|nr:hypothetical protein [Crocinitomicaceae bacterium]
MKPEKKLLITFDYELFLGEKSGTVKNCLISPTNELSLKLNEFGIKGIFFVDTLFLWALKSKLNDSKARQDFEMLKTQLSGLYQQGHYIYPHIHPHWLDAKYQTDSGMWKLSDISKYRFEALSDSEKSQVFSYSDEILKEVLDDNGYRMDAYRAGGWSIQPFKDFQPFFEKYNIKADFTVLGKAHRNTNASVYDFRTIPVAENPYRFSKSVTIKVPEGQYWEFPISSIEFNSEAFTNKLVRKVLWKTKAGQNLGDGIGVQFQDMGEVEKSEFEMVSIELLTTNKLKLYLHYLDQNEYMQFICHPKMVSPHNLKMFSKFLTRAFKRYEIISDWKEMIRES